jgi:hypothetical protein
VRQDSTTKQGATRTPSKRFVEAEAQAAQGYRASVAAQLKADRTAIPKLSDRVVAGLRIVAAAKTDEARAAQDPHGRCGHEARGRHVP